MDRGTLRVSKSDAVGVLQLHCLSGTLVHLESQEAKSQATKLQQPRCRSRGRSKCKASVCLAWARWKCRAE